MTSQTSIKYSLVMSICSFFAGGDDRRVLMWNVEEGISGNPKLTAMNGQHNSNIFCLAFDPSNSKIFSGGRLSFISNFYCFLSCKGSSVRDFRLINEFNVV